MTLILSHPMEALLLTSLVGAVALGFVSGPRSAALLNIAFSGLALFFAVLLVVVPRRAAGLLFADDLNIPFIALNATIGFTTSIFSASYIGRELENKRLTRGSLRLYHVIYQLMLFGMNLALGANNFGLMWVAIELATLSTVMMVGIYRTHAALEAAWKYFILGSVGIALALFGSILVYMAASASLGDGMAAMAWTNLARRASSLDPHLLNVAFVFLVLGYGTKVGLAPMHAWLPDAHAEGPTPASAVLSGLLLNVALYAVLRFKMIMSANPQTIPAGWLLITLGLGSLIFAALMLFRRGDIKRMFAYSSIEHMGLIVFAFGMGGAVGNFAGLLQTAMHSLTKSAIFFSVGHIAQARGTQKMSDITGLTQSDPLLGWTFVVSVLAIAGLPPFGVFASEFMVLSSTLAKAPLLAALAAFGLLAAFSALLLKLASMAFGAAPTEPHRRARVAYLPIFTHLGLVLLGGLYLPSPVTVWLQRAAELLR